MIGFEGMENHIIPEDIGRINQRKQYGKHWGKHTGNIFDKLWMFHQQVDQLKGNTLGYPQEVVTFATMQALNSLVHDVHLLQKYDGSN